MSLDDKVAFARTLATSEPTVWPIAYLLSSKQSLQACPCSPQIPDELTNHILETCGIETRDQTL